MFNQDNLATAHIAQIFGSELLKVQQNARTDGGSTPHIVKIDPKQFLIGQTQYTADRKLEEQQIAMSLQREAEAAYPITEPSSYTPQVVPGTLPPQLATAPTQPQSVPSLPAARSENFVSVPSLDVLERIAVSLERIANAVDKVVIKPKRKTIKSSKSKISKPKNSNPLLLNEANS